MSDLNNQAASGILDLLKESTVLFIGAGMSIPPYKRWWELLEDLCRMSGLQYSPTDDPLLAAQDLHNQNPVLFTSTLKKIFIEAPDYCRPALRHAVNIDFSSWITTNFDRTIEFAFQCINSPLPKVYQFPLLLPSACKNKSIHFIHGRVTDTIETEDKLVFTKSSYDDSYVHTRNISNYLFEVFINNNILFTGYSLSNAEPLNRILHSIGLYRKELIDSSNNPLTRKKWTILLPIDSASPEDAHRFKALNIDILYFDRVDDGFSGLDQVWDLVLTKIKYANKSLSPVAIDILAPLQDNGGYS